MYTFICSHEQSAVVCIKLACTGPQEAASLNRIKLGDDIYVHIGTTFCDPPKFLRF